MARDFGYRPPRESRAVGGSRPELASSSDILLGASDEQLLQAGARVNVKDRQVPPTSALSVLCTVMRRLGYTASRVFDAWMSSGPSEADAEWANDNVRPLVERLLWVARDKAATPPEVG